jgi:NTP pyrophosphatase (non-canonical NTP hydrolase)
MDLLESKPAAKAADRLQVVICGSFHREPESLAETRDRFLAAGAVVLSPIDLDFVAESSGFLFAAHECHEEPATIEERHLAAMRDADLVWLHAPGGYVGASATLELGYAHALGLTVYSAELPNEVAFREMVRVAESPEQTLQLSHPERLGADAPSRGLSALQRYYRRAAQRRGWESESASETVELLRGEIAELETALQVSGGTKKAYGDEDPEAELADVALYLVHLANALEIDLAAAVRAKEEVNARRFGVRLAGA